MAVKQGSAKPADEQAAAVDLDPKFEWLENATNYVLRINLQGFRKDDFRVQVDGAGKLTVRGQRPAAGQRFHKVFQLPSTACLDDISGRFDASVLTLTVPKRAAAAAPTTVEEIVNKEEGAKLPPKDDAVEKKEAAVVKPKEEITKEDADVKKKEEITKSMDEAARKVQQQQQEDAMRRKQTPTPAVRTDDVKPKAPEAAAAPTKKPAVKPEGADGEKAKAVDRESLAERVRRRSDEERAKAAAAEEAEREKKTAQPGGWKERLPVELADMKWADGLVEMARNNKEVVATAIAAFSLGFFVSQKLFSRK